jgi:hypothetical protein
MSAFGLGGHIRTLEAAAYALCRVLATIARHCDRTAFHVHPAAAVAPPSISLATCAGGRQLHASKVTGAMLGDAHASCVRQLLCYSILWQPHGRRA